MNGISSKKLGMQRMILPRNKRMTAILVLILSPDIGYDRIYAQIGAAGKNLYSICTYVVYTSMVYMGKDSVCT